MTLNELILINSDKVRRDSNLMAFYLKSFVEAFGYKPTCTGCTFASDWNKLVKFVSTGEKPITNHQKQNLMNTFKLKKTTNTILAYKLNGRTHRKYDNLLNEEFAVAYLTHGALEEIEQRKKLFAILPDAFKEKTYSIAEEFIDENREKKTVLTEGVKLTEKAKATRKPRTSKKKK